jgi:hypothetical protein
MMRLEWNALRVGSRVLVHDDADAEMALVPGRVAMIQTANGSNELAIRIWPAVGPTRVVNPRRLAVHLEQLDPDGHCWRCDTNTRAVRSTR